ncbi:MAG: P-II family nitrogen regulator [Peptococcaceae bacterium]|nr:P-II family nitrogen regulator [Peptococcaceae bacterium]
MKKVESVIRGNKLDQVEKALSHLGVSGITVSQVLGWGRQKGHITEFYRGKEVEVRLLPKVKIEVIVNDGECDEVKKIIAENAKTGNIGDGVIWVTPVEDFVRIRTAENILD